MRQTLGHLVMSNLLPRHKNLLVAEIVASESASETEVYVRKVHAFAKAQNGADLKGDGYVVVHTSDVPKGVYLDSQRDRIFVSEVVDRGRMYIVKSKLSGAQP